MVWWRAALRKKSSFITGHQGSHLSPTRHLGVTPLPQAVKRIKLSGQLESKYRILGKNSFGMDCAGKPLRSGQAAIRRGLGCGEGLGF